MDRYKETFQTWNKVAKLYEEKFMSLQLYDDTYDAFCDLLPKINSAILEIGCGPGNITKYLLDRRPDLMIEAIDVSPAMIELARVNNPKPKFSVMDSREIDQFESKYEAVISGFCLPYLSEEDCSKLFNDCRRLLNKNGIIYLSFVEGEREQSGYQTASSGDRVYFYHHRLENINAELQKNDFEILKVWNKAYHRTDVEKEKHTILIAQHSKT